MPRFATVRGMSYTHLPLRVLLPAIVFLAAVAACAAPVVENRLPLPTEVGYLPADGDTVSVNPPAIAWLQEPSATSYTVEISRDPEFRNADVHVDDYRYLLYTHTSPLEPGKYYWRYAFETADGQRSAWSKIRSFSIPPGVPQVPRPSRDYISKIIPRQHPRMFMRPEDLPGLRDSRTSLPEEWRALLSDADRALSAPIMREPPPWTDGVWNANEWSAHLGAVTPAAAELETLAFAYLLSRDMRYGEAARQRLLNFVKWAPLGTSSMGINDEVGMPILHSVSRSYSWIHDILTPEEIRVIRSNMAARGNETFRVLRQGPYEQIAFNSHAGRMYHILGEAGIAFYDEIPEAPEWLNYALTIFYGWYPIWGDADGGWAEGAFYWTSYNEKMTWWLDQMSSVLRLDGTKKPFYNHVGDFPYFVAPPGAVMSGFGDFSEKPPWSTRGRVVAAYALARQDGRWQWFADQVGSGDFRGAIRYLRAFRTKPAPCAPTQDSPLLKVFPKAGWAVFNSHIGEATSNTQFMMRCSPYGNISHSHEDQNNIVLGAYGQPLLVNTGIRDYYGSPFCKGYYWATLAHNCLLIDGGGQSRGPESKGHIVASRCTPGFAYAVGDATGAYSTSSLYRRWSAMVPDEAVVIKDEVQTTASAVQLLYHGRAPFTFSDSGATTNARVSLKTGDVQLDGIIFGTSVTLSQVDHYPTIDLARGTTVPEWHLTAHLPVENGRALRVVSVFVPYLLKNGPPATDINVTEREGQTIVTWRAGSRDRRLVLGIRPEDVQFE